MDAPTKALVELLARLAYEDWKRQQAAQPQPGKPADVPAHRPAA